MIRGLTEGWHPIVLLIVVLVLFGGKRLPDAARGLGRSMRIFKSEISQMQDEDSARPSSTPPATASAPEPLEGRVMNGEPTRPQGAEQRHDV